MSNNQLINEGDVKELELIGLTKNDRKVYLALLEVGTETVSTLVKRTGLYRSYIYDVLDKLIELGLVGYAIKNNKRHFSAENPESIIQLIDNRKQALDENKKKLGEIIPILIRKQRSVTEKQEARIFIGKNGIKSVLEDILGVKQDFLVFGAEGKFDDIFKWYFKNWQIRRRKSKIKYKIIYNERLRGKRPTKEQKLIEVKFLPKEYEFPATTIVYGDKVGIIIWGENPVGFVLESKLAAVSFSSSFNLLWKIAKP